MNTTFIMETREEDRIHLLGIADSIREIQGYLGRADYDTYAQREDIRESVIGQLNQIGGAAAMLSDEFKDKYADVDWDVLKGLQYAHFDQELELDLHPQWHIVKNDLPIVMDDIMDLLTTIEREEAMEAEIGPADEPVENPGAMPYFTENGADLRETRMEFDDDDAFDDDEEDDFDDDIFDENVDVDNLDMEDDSFIDRRFTDDDLMDDSSLDDDVFDEDEEELDDDEF
jgi:uncharacterized protein with HEPN domain